MSKTKSPRRAYDPKRLRRMIVGKAVSEAQRARQEAEYRAGMMNLTTDALRDLGIAYHSAFALMRQYGGEDHFHTLAAAINIAGRFCDMGIGDEYAADIEAAIGALNRVRERADRLGKWALDGEGMQQVARALKIHDAQMESATYNELRDAIQSVFELNRLDRMAEAA
jgi:uncharacterized protein YjiS (DUF1127 family)